MIIDAYATDTVPSHEVRRRANEALAAAGEPMSEVTYDALRKRIAELEAALRDVLPYVDTCNSSHREAQAKGYAALEGRKKDE